MRFSRSKGTRGGTHRAPNRAAGHGRYGPAAARAIALVAFSALALSAAGPARAQRIEAGRSTIDGGGASFIAAGSFVLGGTIGQPDAGSLAAGPFALLGGFWGGGLGAAVSVEDDPLPHEAAVPAVLRVYPASPNPSFGGADLRVDLPRASEAEVDVYDLNGALVRSRIKRFLPAGRTAVSWDGRDDAGKRVGAGLYFIRVRIGEQASTHKLVVVR